PPPEEIRPRRHHELREGRLDARRPRLPGAALRPPPRERNGLHAGAERSLPDRRLQPPERSAADEARRRRDHPIARRHLVEGRHMTRNCHRTGVASVPVGRVTGSLSLSASDELSVEEPLAIRVAEYPDGGP